MSQGSRTVALRTFGVAMVSLLSFGHSCAALFARDLYVVMASDPDSQSVVGKASSRDVSAFSHVLKENIDTDHLHINDPVEPTRNRILAEIGRLPAKEGEDAVMFYYSGHGAYDIRNRHYFAITSKERLYRDEVMKAIQSLRPRLAILISDVCFAPDRRYVRPGISYASEPTTDKTKPLFESLFFNATGGVDLTSSKPNEYSAVYQDFSKGSYFTHSLLEVCESKRELPLTWAQVVYHSSKLTAQAYRTYSLPTDVPLPDGRTVRQTTQSPYAFALPPPRLGLRVVDSDSRVRVTQVAESSPAMNAGILVGDIVTAIDGMPISTEQEFYDLILGSGNTQFEISITGTDAPNGKAVVLKFQ